MSEDLHQEIIQEQEPKRSSEPSAELPQLSDQYECRALIGKGSAGLVYRAFDKTMRRDVAIKVFPTAATADRKMQERFLREIKVLASISHPNVVQIFNTEFNNAGDLYLVMELLAGETLDSILKKDKILSAARFYEIFSQVLQGLASIHEQGIVHRDLKPGNIMIMSEAGAPELAKIIGLGVAKVLDLASTLGSTTTAALLADPAYMSPEQAKGGAIDQRSDIYVIACIRYESLSGKPPFIGASAVETMYKRLNESPPQLYFAGKNKRANQLAQLIEKSLSVDINQRAESAQNMLERLREIFPDGANSAVDLQAGSGTGKTAIAAVTAVAVLLLVLVSIWFNQHSQRVRQESQMLMNAPLSKKGINEKIHMIAAKIHPIANASHPPWAQLDQWDNELRALTDKEKLTAEQEFAAIRLRIDMDFWRRSKEPQFLEKLYDRLRVLAAVDATMCARCWADQAQDLLARENPVQAEKCAKTALHLLEVSPANSKAFTVSPYLWEAIGAGPKIAAYSALGTAAAMQGNFEAAMKNYDAANNADHNPNQIMRRNASGCSDLLTFGADKKLVIKWLEKLELSSHEVRFEANDTSLTDLAEIARKSGDNKLAKRFLEDALPWLKGTAAEKEVRQKLETLKNSK